MHTCYNGRAKRFRMGGCHDVSKVIFASNKKSARALRRGVLGSWFPVLGDEKENTFFCISKCRICLQNGGKKAPSIITTLIFITHR